VIFYRNPVTLKKCLIINYGKNLNFHIYKEKRKIVVTFFLHINTFNFYSLLSFSLFSLSLSLSLSLCLYELFSFSNFNKTVFHNENRVTNEKLAVAFF